MNGVDAAHVLISRGWSLESSIGVLPLRSHCSGVMRICAAGCTHRPRLTGLVGLKIHAQVRLLAFGSACGSMSKQNLILGGRSSVGTPCLVYSILTVGTDRTQIPHVAWRCAVVGKHAHNRCYFRPEQPLDHVCGTSQTLCQLRYIERPMIDSGLQHDYRCIDQRPVATLLGPEGADCSDSPRSFFLFLRDYIF